MSNLQLPDISSYHSAERVLGNRDERKIGYETRMFKSYDDSIIIRHHETNIIQYYQDGRIRLDTNGWRTRTTCARLNTLTPFSISGPCYVWTGYHESKRAGEWEIRTSTDSAVFHDGMIIPADGSLQEHKARIFVRAAS